jgi:hypothetical protein
MELVFFFYSAEISPKQETKNNKLSEFGGF